MMPGVAREVAFSQDVDTSESVIACGPGEAMEWCHSSIRSQDTLRLRESDDPV